MGQRALHEPAAPAPPTCPPVTARNPPLQVTHESPWRRRSSFGMRDDPLRQLDLDNADLPVSEVWRFYVKLLPLTPKYVCVPSLSDGRIIGGIDDQAFRSKLIRPDLLTKFWTLKPVMSDKKSISHIHLDQEHYRNNSDTKDSSKYLQTFWRMWIKYHLNWNSFWDCVGRSEDCEVEEVFFFCTVSYF